MPAASSAGTPIPISRRTDDLDIATFIRRRGNLGASHESNSRFCPLLVPIIERRLLEFRDNRLIGRPVELLLEVGLGVCDELRIGEQIRAGEGERLGRDHHALLADAHAGGRRRLPGVGDDAGDEGRSGNRWPAIAGLQERPQSNRRSFLLKRQCLNPCGPHFRSVLAGVISVKPIYGVAITVRLYELHDGGLALNLVQPVTDILNIGDQK